jgi:hypothetical protein
MNFAQSPSSAHSLSSHSSAKRSPPLRPIKYSVTPLESALLQVLILKNFNLCRINTYDKPGGGGFIIVNQLMVNHSSAHFLPGQGNYPLRRNGVGWRLETGSYQTGAEEIGRRCVVYN